VILVQLLLMGCCLPCLRFLDPAAHESEVLRTYPSLHLLRPLTEEDVIAYFLKSEFTIRVCRVSRGVRTSGERSRLEEFQGKCIAQGIAVSAQRRNVEELPADTHGLKFN